MRGGRLAYLVCGRSIGKILALLKESSVHESRVVRLQPGVGSRISDCFR